MNARVWQKTIKQLMFQSNQLDPSIECISVFSYLITSMFHPNVYHLFLISQLDIPSLRVIQLYMVVLKNTKSICLLQEILGSKHAAPPHHRTKQESTHRSPPGPSNKNVKKNGFRIRNVSVELTWATWVILFICCRPRSIVQLFTQFSRQFSSLASLGEAIGSVGWELLQETMGFDHPKNCFFFVSCL